VLTDFAAASWMMARSVEGARPDIALFVRGLATSSWHWTQLRAHPAFDGKPRASRGKNNHDRYARGAILEALPRIAVVLERELPGVHASTILGPYVLLDPSQTQQLPSAEGPAGEHLLQLIAREARLGPPGDTGAAAAVVRDFLCLRSRRLFQLGLYARALESVRLALWQLPENERARVRLSAQASTANLPFIVDDPRTYLVSSEDAVRQAAALLWALSDRAAASTLLQHQLQREDPLALLQLAHLQAASGERDRALRTLTALAPLLPGPQHELAQVREAFSR
jgi:tetratricopeptide (TPR) repeat protein